MNPVTDPDVLAQLNSGGTNGPVTDPALLAQLNSSFDPNHAMDVATGAMVRGAAAVPLGILDFTDRILPFLHNAADAAARPLADAITGKQTPSLAIPYPPSLNQKYQDWATKEFGLAQPENTVENYINSGVTGWTAGPVGVMAGLGAQAGHDLPLSSQNVQIGRWDTGISPQDMATTLGAVLGGASMNAVTPTPKGDITVPTNSDVKLIKKQLDLAGITPQQYADALQNSTPEDFAGELGGEPLRMQTQAQAKITGPSMQEARDAMRQRLATALPRTQNILAQTLGPQSEISDRLAEIEGYRAQQPELYANVNGLTPSSSFQDVVNTPAGQNALKQTAINLANNRIDPLKAGFVQDANGNLSLAENVPNSTWHEFSKALNGQISRDAFGNIADPAAARPIQGLSADVGNILKQNDPNFQLAQQVAAQAKQGQQAFDNARQVARMVSGDKAETVLEPLSQNPFAVAGFHQGLLDKLSDTPLQGGNPANTIAKASLIQRVGDLTGDQAKAQALGDALVQEKNRIDLAQRGLYGSNTAETLTSGIAKPPTSAEGIVSKIADKLNDLLASGKNERLANLLYATTPEQKAAIANSLIYQNPEKLGNFLTYQSMTSNPQQGGGQ